MTYDTHPILSFCKTSSGGTPSRSKPEYYNGPIPWVKSGELREEVVNITSEHITEMAIKESSAKMIPAGALLVAMYGATIGRVAYLGIPAATNQAVCNIIPDETRADRQYLFYALRSKAREWIGRGAGGAQPNISQKIIQETKIPLPPLEEQRRIAAILDKADAIRKKRQQAIELTEQFLRSTFLDMFGDPVFNQKKHPFIPLSELSDGKDGIKCGPFGTQLGKHEFTSKGVPLWGIKHVNKHFSLKTYEYVSHEKAHELGSYRLTSGDVVMTRKGTIGNASVYPEGFEDGIMHSDLLRLRVNTNKCSPLFLSFQFALSRDVEHQIARVSSGAVMAGINVSKLKEVSVIVPPISQQRQFESLVVRQKGLQVKLMSSQGCGSDLFAALQQRAFRGEL